MLIRGASRQARGPQKEYLDRLGNHKGKRKERYGKGESLDKLEDRKGNEE